MSDLQDSVQKVVELQFELNNQREKYKQLLQFAGNEQLAS